MRFGNILIIDKFATLDKSNKWLSKLISFSIWLNHHQCKLQIIDGILKNSILNFPNSFNASWSTQTLFVHTNISLPTKTLLILPTNASPKNAVLVQTDAPILI